MKWNDVIKRDRKQADQLTDGQCVSEFSSKPNTDEHSAHHLRARAGVAALGRGRRKRKQRAPGGKTQHTR